MNRRVKSSLLWGVVAALALLVGVQGLRLLGGPEVTLVVAVGAAMVAGAGASVLTYLLEARLVANGQT